MNRPRVVDLTAVVTGVLTAPPRLGPVRLVVVDGPSGSGKTTLADRLRAVFDADTRRPRTALVHLDDLYEGWSGLDGDHGNGTVSERLLTGLFEPLSQGRPGRWRRYDWPSGAFAEWHEVPVPDVVILEGCGSADPAYADRTTRTLWVEADRDLRIRRGIARDGELMRAHWQAWQRAEDELFTTRRTRALADLRIDGAPTAAHDPVRQMVLAD